MDANQTCLLENMYVSEEELPRLIDSCHEPHPHCPECGAIAEEHSLNEMDNWFHACWFCQKLFPYYELNWENCFGSCDDAGEKVGRNAQSFQLVRLERF